MENEDQENRHSIQIEGGGAVVTGGSKIEIKGKYAAGRDINIKYYSSAIHGKSWLYTQGIRPPADPTNIFGRQRELKVIDEFFKQNTALAIIGLRGTGKSTLASMYLDRIEKRGEYAGIYWRKMDANIDISDVVGSFFTVIGKPIQDIGQYKPGDMLSLLFRELNAAPYFLVLDNFEILLDPQTNTPLKEKAGFSDLIEKTNESNRSRVIFTSWECPASERGKRPKCYPVGGLDEVAALQLLRQSGLTESDDELKKAATLAAGHPLALILLVQLAEEGAETLSSIFVDSTLWDGEVAKNILDKIYKERLSEEEHKLLQYVSLYREPVPLKAIVAAANDPYWTDAFVKKTAFDLMRKSLLQKTWENYWEESLIHSYAYSKLADRIERHELACQYYLSLPLPEKHMKKEDIQSLIEAYYHACKAEDYDQAVSIIIDNNLDQDLDRWGSYRTLVELYNRILPKNHFSDEILLSDIQIHSRTLGSLGKAYRNLGKARKAIEYYEKALKIAQEIRDKKGESTWVGNIGIAYSNLGDGRKAIEYYEKALKLAQEIGDYIDEGIWIGNLGVDYVGLGDGRKAIGYLEKSLKIAQENGDKRNEGIYIGNLGNAYRCLSEARKAIEYYEKALKIAQEIGDNKGESLWAGNLGNVHNDLGEVTKAIEYHEKALKIAHEIGDKNGEGHWVGNLGVDYCVLSEVRKAIECHEKALKIAQEIGNKRGEGMQAGSLGNAYRDLGEATKAIEYHEKALKIAQEIGDKRGEGMWAGNIGNAYNDVGEERKAIEYHEKALKIAQEIGDKNNEGLWAGNIGIDYKHLGEERKAIEYYEKALKIAQEIGNKEWEVTRLLQLGIAYRALDEERKANEFEEKALKIMESGN